MMSFLLPAVALATLAAQPSGGQAQSDLSPWLKARAEEYREYLRTRGSQRSDAPGPLWRERAPGDAALPGFAPPTSLAPLIRAVSHSVVNVSAMAASDGAGPLVSEAEQSSLGSGFILTPSGYVVTNNHVVEKAQKIQVRLADGREFPAEAVGRDASTDVALLRLLGEGLRDLPFTYLGDSDRLEVGDWVMAIGNPFGLDHSVSQGIISAKERVIGVGPFDDFIQTDALINPGNSGGPLFNMRGEVVGVNTAIITKGQGIGFAVPINMVKDLLPNLQVNGRLERGWLGVNIYEEARTGQGPSKGAVVKDVFRGSPAAGVGIRPGDRLMAVNGHPVESYLQLLRRIAFLPPGTDATLSLLRGGAVREVRVKLGQRPAAEPTPTAVTPGDVDRLGLVVRDISGNVASSLRLPPYSGVLVSLVLAGGPADQVGIRAGDVVTEINRRAVHDVRAFNAAIENLGNERTALLRFQRGEVAKYVAVRLE